MCKHVQYIHALCRHTVSAAFVINPCEENCIGTPSEDNWYFTKNDASPPYSFRHDIDVVVVRLKGLCSSCCLSRKKPMNLLAPGELILEQRARDLMADAMWHVQHVDVIDPGFRHIDWSTNAISRGEHELESVPDPKIVQPEPIQAVIEDETPNPPTEPPTTSPIEVNQGTQPQQDYRSASVEALEWLTRLEGTLSCAQLCRMTNPFGLPAPRNHAAHFIPLLPVQSQSMELEQNPTSRPTTPPQASRKLLPNEPQPCETTPSIVTSQATASSEHHFAPMQTVRLRRKGDLGSVDAPTELLPVPLKLGSISKLKTGLDDSEEVTAFIEQSETTPADSSSGMQMSGCRSAPNTYIPTMSDYVGRRTKSLEDVWLPNRIPTPPMSPPETLLTTTHPTNGSSHNIPIICPKPTRTIRFSNLLPKRETGIITIGMRIPKPITEVDLLLDDVEDIHKGNPFIANRDPSTAKSLTPYPRHRLRTPTPYPDPERSDAPLNSPTSSTLIPSQHPVTLALTTTRNKGWGWHAIESTIKNHPKKSAMCWAAIVMAFASYNGMY